MLVTGDILAFSFALIPLVTMPAIAWLTWWLVVRDFHQ